MTRFTLPFLAAFTLWTGSWSFAQTQIEVTVETLGPVGLAPSIVNFSDGSLDIFDVGSAASSALEDLAETGSTAGFSPASGGTLFGPGVGPGSPPIFGPAGATASTVFEVDNNHRLFQIAAMILPSNDWFVGNDAAIDVFSLLGAPLGSSLTLELSSAYDAGTEAEDFDFSPGNGLIGITNPGGGDPDFGTDTPGGVVSLVMDPDPYGTFLNIEPADFDTTAADFTGGPIALVTLTTVPEPTGWGWLSLIAAALAAVKRRR